jgi:hypothetical protein
LRFRRQHLPSVAVELWRCLLFAAGALMQTQVVAQPRDRVII